MTLTTKEETIGRVLPSAAMLASPERDAMWANERPRLEALARRLVWSHEDARDVVQSAYVDAVAKWSTLRDETKAAAWLRRLVVHRAYSHLRQRRVWQVVSTLLWLEPEVAPSAEEAAEQRGHHARLGEALSRLPARQSVAFTLRYLEGMGLDDVAFSMGIDRGTVRVHLQRAVKTLRQHGVLTGSER